MFGPHDHRRTPNFGFGFFGPRRWAESDGPGDWPFGRWGRRWRGGFGDFGQGGTSHISNPGEPGALYLSMTKAGSLLSCSADLRAQLQMAAEQQSGPVQQPIPTYSRPELRILSW